MFGKYIEPLAESNELDSWELDKINKNSMKIKWLLLMMAIFGFLASVNLSIWDQLWNSIDFFVCQILLLLMK